MPLWPGVEGLKLLVLFMMLSSSNLGRLQWTTGLEKVLIFVHLPKPVQLFNPQILRPVFKMQDSRETSSPTRRPPSKEEKAQARGLGPGKI